MSTNSAYLTVRGIDIDVVYKKIKNLHIGVYPPIGRVRVAAPEQLDDDQVRLAVIHRLPWIKRQRQQLREAERQSEREMITGESHYVWGVRHRLEVVERSGRPEFEIKGGRLVLYAPAGTSSQRKRDLLDRWNRDQLRLATSEYISRAERKLKVSVPSWSIRRMKTKWGTCNRETGHIYLNVELAKKLPDCLEYIVLHEAAHLLERSHDDRFAALLDRTLPDWRTRRDQLNGAPLDAQKWSA
jgi:predicted metal-dependent hydrolase